MTPGAAKRTAFQKNRGPDPWTVMNGIFSDIKNNSFLHFEFIIAHKKIKIKKEAGVHGLFRLRGSIKGLLIIAIEARRIHQPFPSSLC